MVVFKPNRKKTNPVILKELIIFLASLVAVIAVAHYFLDIILNSFFFIIYGCIILFRFGWAIFSARIIEVSIDEENTKLTFLYQQGFGGVKERTIPFNEVRLEVEGGSGWFRKNLVLYFVRGKFDVFRLSGYKDGFSTPVLIAIREAMHNNGMRVSKY